MKLPEAMRLMESMQLTPFDITVEELDKSDPELSETLGSLVERFCNDWKALITEARKDV
jgi:hypothetical protein